MRTRFFLALAVSIFTSGCALAGQSKPARMQEAALELNLNARFGRMELAVERVSPKQRDAFMERRKAWGGVVRLADYELTGLRILPGEEEAETSVKIAWYRASENELRQTTLKQKWRDFKGDWKLTDETRVEGDVGLIGEAPVLVPTNVAAAPARRAQFPTIRLGNGNSLGSDAPEEVPSAAAPARGPAPAAPAIAGDPSPSEIH